MMLSPMRRSSCGESTLSPPPRSGRVCPPAWAAVCPNARGTPAAARAAKGTAGLIPLARPLALWRVAVDFERQRRPRSVKIVVRVECRGPTGVEMEALTAAAVGLLTVYDMVKAVDRAMVLTDVRLEEKSGGRSGGFRRPAAKIRR